MDEALLHAITDLGDGALTLPLAALLAVALWSQQSLNAALTWMGALLAGLVALTVLKVAGHTCAAAFGTRAPVSPSGHAAFAAMTYGAVAVIVARHAHGPIRWLAGFAAVTIVGAVSVTRLLLAAHSAAEIAMGLAIGSLSVALFARRYRTLPPAVFRPRRAAAAMAGFALLLVALHGGRLKAEGVIRGVAAELRAQVSACR